MLTNFDKQKLICFLLVFAKDMDKSRKKIIINEHTKHSEVCVVKF